MISWLDVLNGLLNGLTLVALGYGIGLLLEVRRTIEQGQSKEGKHAP